MMMMKTRFRGNGGAMSAGLLPADVRHDGAPLPSLPMVLSRRAAIFGAVASTHGLPDSQSARSSSARANDLRLAAIVDEMAALHAAIEAYPSPAFDEDDSPEYLDRVQRYAFLEARLDQIPSAGIAGILAKIRALELPTTGTHLNPACFDTMVSVVEDITRLHAIGGLV